MDWVVNKQNDILILKNPDQNLVSTLIYEVWDTIPEQLVYNTWRKINFCYYKE